MCPVCGAAKDQFEVVPPSEWYPAQEPNCLSKSLTDHTGRPTGSKMLSLQFSMTRNCSVCSTVIKGRRLEKCILCRTPWTGMEIKLHKCNQSKFHQTIHLSCADEVLAPGKTSATHDVTQPWCQIESWCGYLSILQPQMKLSQSRDICDTRTNKKLISKWRVDHLFSLHTKNRCYFRIV